MVSRAAERFDELVVTAPFCEHCRRGITRGFVHSVPAVDAVVVEHDDDNGQSIATYDFDLHAFESEGAVALDRDDLGTGLNSRSDRKSVK